MTRVQTKKYKSILNSNATTKLKNTTRNPVPKAVNKTKNVTSLISKARPAVQLKKATKPRQKASPRVVPQQPTSTFFFKLVLYIILGSFWLRFTSPLDLGLFELQALPVGLFVGLLFIRFEMSLIDRKIQLAVLLIVTVMSLFLNTGIII